MSKHEKTLIKLCATPTPSNIKWDDLAGVLKYLGYIQQNNSGSRRKFFHKDKNDLIICHEPHPTPEVDKGCIDDVVEHLKSKNFIT